MNALTMPISVVVESIVHLDHLCEISADPIFVEQARGQIDYYNDVLIARLVEMGVERPSLAASLMILEAWEAI